MKPLGATWLMKAFITFKAMQSLMRYLLNWLQTCLALKMVVSHVFLILKKGSMDCGLLEIAYMTTLGYEEDPSQMSYEQSNLRAHLIEFL